MTSSRKGADRERELATELDDRGFAVIRAPASGSATSRELPDVFAGNGDRFYAFEVKASKRDSAIYLYDDEVRALEYFAGGFQARPRLAIRFDYTDWAFFNPEDVYRTDSGNYRVRHEDVVESVTVGIDDL